MHYRSPNEADLGEVRVLNKAFLDLLRDPRESQRIVGDLPATVARRLPALSDSQADRLADAPFLLFSLHESDSDYWEAVHAEPGTYSLFANGDDSCTDRARLVAAAVGFVWQMARQNPYTLRLICCASLHWCEILGGQPLITAIGRATRRPDALVLRASRDEALWDKLLTAGLNRRSVVRQAACRSVLQTLLIGTRAPRRQAWRSAACRRRIPSVAIRSGD